MRSAEPNTQNATGTLTDYPEPAAEVRYGRAVWALGEDGEQGWIVAGHDRASLVGFGNRRPLQELARDG